MEGKKLHIVMIPWLGFGHMICYLELSKCLAKHGHKISYISTPHNVKRLSSRIPSYLSSLINLVPLTLPQNAISGLPENAEATIDVPREKIPCLMQLQETMEGPARNFIGSQDPLPDWIIYDLYVPWAPIVANAFGLPCACFITISALALAYISPPSELMPDEQLRSAAVALTTTIVPEDFMAPPPWVTIPTKVALRYHEALDILTSNTFEVSGSPLLHRLATCIRGSPFVAVRSSIEFEPEWFRLLEEIHQKPFIPISCLSPTIQDSYNSKEDDKNSSNLIEEDTEWLDAQQHSSTVYVAFGSEMRLNKEQTMELTLGLEFSGLHFLWVYRGDLDMIPEGFQKRTEGLGRVHFGWLPQTKLLGHPSVGGFLTHCGWGSTVEGLGFGKAMIMLPLGGDQGWNARMLAEKKVGVEVERDERDGSFTRDGVARALRMVMVEEQGETFRSNAADMQKIISDEALQQQYLHHFMQHLIRNCKHTQTS